MSLHDSSDVSSWANYGGRDISVFPWTLRGRDISVFPWTLRGGGGRKCLPVQTTGGDTSVFPWTLQGRGDASVFAGNLQGGHINFFWVFSTFEINSGKDILITPAACVNAVSVLLLNNVTLTLFSLRHFILQCLLRRGINRILNMRIKRVIPESKGLTVSFALLLVNTDCKYIPELALKRSFLRNNIVLRNYYRHW